MCTSNITYVREPMRINNREMWVIYYFNYEF